MKKARRSLASISRKGPPKWSTKARSVNHPHVVKNKTFFSKVSLFLFGNDRWNFFEGIPINFSFRTKVRLKMENSDFGNFWEALQTLLSLAACVLYVVDTYIPNSSPRQLELVFMWCFAIDYLLKFYCSENRWIYPFTIVAIVDMVAIAPSVFQIYFARNTEDSRTFAFMRFVRVLRIVRLLRLMKVSGNGSISAVQKQITALALTVSTIVFISAGLIHTMEEFNRTPTEPQLSFGEALYFIVVTISTVGYGDISPLTTYGKLVTSGMIVVSLVIVPMEINQLSELLSMQSRFRTTYKPEIGNPHVLVVGHTTNASTLLDFFTEFYHPDRIVYNSGGSSSASSIPCIIMSPQEPSEEIRNVIVNPILQNKVRFIKGSVMSDEDMYRVGADAARACFILTDKTTSDPIREDANTVLRSLVIENFNTELDTFVQLINPAYIDYLDQAEADHVLCVDQTKLSIMAKSCICPGLSTLISNLFRSTTSSKQIGKKDWQHEYVEGSSLEIYTTMLPSILHGLTFTQAVQAIYDVFDGSVTLLGVDELIKSDEEVNNNSTTKRKSVQVKSHRSLLKDYCKKNIGSKNDSSSDHSENEDNLLTTLYVNPGNMFRIRPGQVVYVLCESKNIAENVACENFYYNWFKAGNGLPKTTKDKKRLNSVNELLLTDVRLHANQEKVKRAKEDVLISEAVDLQSGISFTGHIIVLTNLFNVPIETFIKPLRLSHYTPGSIHYKKILFLSLSKNGVDEAITIAQKYSDVYLMKGSDHKKNDLLQAGILRAKCCVLLSDKTEVKQMDGETLDSNTIFHFLTIEKILADFPSLKSEKFMTLVEMTVTSTMKVMDTTLRKRVKKNTKTSFRQKRINTMSSDINEASLPKKNEGVIDSLKKWGSKAYDEIAISKSIRRHRMRQMKDLQEKLQKKKQVQFGIIGYVTLPFFAAGYGFSTDIFDSLLCQSFFTPELLRFAQELLCIEDDRHQQLSPLTNVKSNECSTLQAKIALSKKSEYLHKYNHTTSSSLFQIPMPSCFANRTYEDLFHYLVGHEEVVPIGLYRGKNTSLKNILPYVFTGPKKDTKLHENDLVFVLAQPHTQIAMEGTIQESCEDNVEKKIMLRKESKNSVNLILNRIKKEKTKHEGTTFE